MTSEIINKSEDLKNISKNITKLYFSYEFNDPINDLIPYWIKRIDFNPQCKFNYSCDMLPDGLKELYFGEFKNHTLEEISNFPKSLKRLALGGEFDEELKENILPKNLTYLVFGSSFNQKIKENILPKKLKCLIFRCSFNQEIKENVLPPSLEELKLGFNFNQEIKENVLPLKLIELTLGNNYNKLIEQNILPKNLIHICFGEFYSYELGKYVLPTNLKSITINKKNIHIKKIFRNYSKFRHYKSQLVSNIYVKN